ncbi:MAG: phenylacetate--CoA ligase family protein [Chloroflexi bacterium]|nr:phenylacetate--CoA ligase family protein [Chloroflexota bacterium]
MLLLDQASSVLHRTAIRAGYRLAYARSPLARRHAELERSQWWPRERILDLQWAKLQRLIRHVYQQVPHYREAMEALGMEPQDLRGPEDYARLPLLSKQEINAQRETLVAVGFPRSRLIRTASGGSTGAPVGFYHDPDMVTSYRAVKLRNFRWAGWEPGDAWARLWGSQFDVAPHQALGQRLWDRLTRVLVLPCWDLTTTTMRSYGEALLRFQPAVIEAYVTPMYHFARFLQQEGITGIRPRGIICSAEMLFPHQRELIQQVFQCKVFNRYGGREMGDVAHECPAGTMHVNAESIYVEFIRDGRPARVGESGELVLTALDLYGMPLLRYRVEDMGAPSDAVCPCGRGLPAMEVVEGRVQDLITLPGGRYLPGEFFPHLFKDFDVAQFQVVQDRLEHLTIRLVRGSQLTEQQVTYLLDKVREYTEGAAQIDLEFCQEIPATPSGKFRYTISHVPPQLTRPPEAAHA